MTAEYHIDLTPEEVLSLSDGYDVMVLGAGALHSNFAGSKKNPNTRAMPIIQLDEKGGRFRQR